MDPLSGAFPEKRPCSSASQSAPEAKYRTATMAAKWSFDLCAQNRETGSHLRGALEVVLAVDRQPGGVLEQVVHDHHPHLRMQWHPLNNCREN